jgi:hypothetical protein
MKKSIFHDIILPILTVLIGGFILVCLSWLIYLGIYLGIETVFFPNNPTDVPADQIRRYAVLFLGLLSSLIIFTKCNHIIKATILVAPMTMSFIWVILSYYMNTWVAVIVLIVVTLTLILLIIRLEKPWIYYISIAFSIILAILYAWPQAQT